MYKVSLTKIIEFLMEEKQKFQTQISEEVTLAGFSSLDRYRPDTITWVKSADKWQKDMPEIALCVVQEGVELPLPNQIICENSKAVFFRLIEHFFVIQEDREPPIGRNTVIGDRVRLGRNVRIGHNCSITGDVVIGDDTVIHDNVVIRHKVRIGSRCVIESLTMIGEDGFGAYEEENHRKVMIKHYGGVTIGDDVYLGSHVDIERGTIDDTYIGDGVKVAPFTLIAHNGFVGRDSVIICSHLYGSAHLEENAWVAGSIVKNQCRVGENAVVGIGTVVTRDVPEGKVAVGVPARILRDSHETMSKG